MSARELGNALGNPLALPRTGSSANQVASQLYVPSIKHSIGQVTTSLNTSGQWGSTKSLLFTPIYFKCGSVLTPVRVYTGGYYYYYALFTLDKNSLALTNTYCSSGASTTYQFLAVGILWQYYVSDYVTIVLTEGGSLRKYTLSGNDVTVSYLSLTTSGTYANSGTSFASLGIISYMIENSVIHALCYDNNKYLCVQKYDLNFNLLGTYRSDVMASKVYNPYIRRTDFGYLYCADDATSTTVLTNFISLTDDLSVISSVTITTTFGSMSALAHLSFYDDVNGIFSRVFSKNGGSYNVNDVISVFCSLDGVLTSTSTTYTASSEAFNCLPALPLFPADDNFANILGVKANPTSLYTLDYDCKTNLLVCKPHSNYSQDADLYNTPYVVTEAYLRSILMDKRRLSLLRLTSDFKVFGAINGNGRAVQGYVIRVDNFLLAVDATSTNTSVYIHVGAIA